MVFSEWLVAALSALAGAGGTYAGLQRQLRGMAAERDAARTRLAAREAELAAAPVALSALRHDLRGILSPAMLTADRLLLSADPATKRAGEVVLRTVERATARLAETKDQPGSSSDQG